MKSPSTPAKKASTFGFLLFLLGLFLSTPGSAQVVISNCPSEIVNLTSGMPTPCQAEYVLPAPIVTNPSTGVTVTWQSSGATTYGPGQPIAILESGAAMNYGVTQLTITATDLSNNTYSCDIIVVVTEAMEVPLAICDDVTVDITGDCMNTLVLPDLVTVDPGNCAGGTLSFSYDGGSQTSLTVDTDDLSNSPLSATIYVQFNGNTGTCGQEITIIDSTVPGMNCPNTETIEVAPTCGINYIYDLEAFVGCGNYLDTIQGETSGFLLTSGIYDYEIELKDMGDQLIQSCTWTITVQESPSAGAALMCVSTPVNVDLSPDGCAVTIDPSQLLANNVCPNLSALTMQTQLPSGEMLEGPTLTLEGIYDELPVQVFDPNGINSCTALVNVADPTGCVPPIPTLSQWGVIMLSMIMLILGLVSIKQRKVILG